MDEYEIHVTKSGFDGKYAVGFTTGKSHPSKKEFTFCVIRMGEASYPYCGCAVCNPRDSKDDVRGKRAAFKRAVESMLSEWGMPEDVEAYVMSRFRGALWIAMGRPGYKKELPTVDLSGKTQYVVNIPIR